MSIRGADGASDHFHGMLMSDKTQLYLLVFPVRDLLKIGKADDIHKRIQTLRRFWGEADYAASYHVEASIDTVFKLERSLHFLLERYRRFDGEGDGKTELFSLEALDIALKHIELFLGTRPELQGIKKGVPRPVLATAQQARKRPRQDRLQTRSKAMVTSVEKLARQFGRINRLLSVLHRRQSRIAFQYDIIDDVVYFRLQTPGADTRRDIRDTPLDYFHFEIKDLNGWGSANCCTLLGEGDVIQFEIRMPFLLDTAWTDLFTYFIGQSREFLKRLPSRSAAAAEPIPLLDFDDFMSGLGGEMPLRAA